MVLKEKPRQKSPPLLHGRSRLTSTNVNWILDGFIFDKVKTNLLHCKRQCVACHFLQGSFSFCALAALISTLH